jgi:hypothetical protein
MKKLIILFSAIILVFSSCESMKVVSDYDKNVNFSKYKTYNVLQWDKEESVRINEFDQKRIINALHEQMQARGYKRVDSGSDISVNPFLILDAKEQTTAYTNHYNMGGYGYYGGFGYYGFGPAYNMGTTTFHTEQYTVGTLIIDVLDNKTKRLIWQGIGKGTIKESRQDRDKNIPKAIAKIMEPYPIEPVKK